MKRRMLRASLGLFSLVALGAVIAAAQAPPIDAAKARQYFAEAKALSDRDNGALWKVPLCGPLIFVDYDTRYAVANQADAEGKLKPLDGVFVGTAPEELGVANTAAKWAGVDWTMVMWPLPQYTQPRLRLVMHECFHRVQSQIGLNPADTQNGHLDSLAGRIWLQMEWRALEHAFWQQGEERKRDIADAIYFRNYRRSFFPAAAANENAMETHEGMAEYTGFKLSTGSPEEYAVQVAAWLRAAPTRTPSYGRSFAYTSGPAYGGLLDAAGKNWRATLKTSDNLGQLLAAAYGVQIPAALEKAEAMRRAERYNGGEVVAIETEREATHQAQITAVRKLFVDGPVLVLPAGREFNFTFDPNAVLALDDKLTLYEGEIKVTDEWGLLKATGGVVIVRENGRFIRAQVPAPTDISKTPLAGKGWTLELKPHWQIFPEGRAGDFVARASNP